MASYTIVHQLVSGPAAATTTVTTFSPAPLLADTGTGQGAVYYNKGDVVVDTVLNGVVGSAIATRLLGLGAIV